MSRIRLTSTNYPAKGLLKIGGEGGETGQRIKDRERKICILVYMYWC